MSRALRIKSAAPSNPNLHANTSCMFQHGAFAVVKDTLSSVSFKAMRLPADLSATLALYHPGSYAAVSLFDVGSSSPQPQSYASPMSSQLNSGFPSRLLTMLCTKQPHMAAAVRDETWGGYLASTCPKCSAHSPQGIGVGTGVHMTAAPLAPRL